MSKQAFISISYDKRSDFDDSINTLKSLLQEFDITPYIFVDNYHFDGDERNMMESSKIAINKSDFVIAEVSHKAIGIGVEVGYAIGIGKPVIYIRHDSAEHSKTIAGIANHQITYTMQEDLHHKLYLVLQILLN
ncbi:MAG: nucleoside 2-deoxyribosyltransferase [Chloroflexota bacterium]